MQSKFIKGVVMVTYHSLSNIPTKIRSIGYSVNDAGLER